MIFADNIIKILWTHPYAADALFRGQENWKTCQNIFWLN